MRLSCAVVDAATLAAGKASSRNISPANALTSKAGKTALILHGLMGSHRNWLQFTRQLVRKHPEWRFMLLDLPGHGDRAGNSHTQCSRPGSLYAAAKDLHDTVASNPVLFPGGWSCINAAIGHSMGGRVLLKLLQSFPAVAEEQRSPRAMRVVTLDTMPGMFDYASRDQDADGVSRVLSFVKALPPAFPSRQWLQAQCSEAGFSKGMAQWMATNTTAHDSGDGLCLSFDVAMVQQLLHSHQHTSQWDVLKAPPGACELHAVLATRSSRWRDPLVRSALDEVRGAPQAAQLHWLEGGHWLHVDNSKGLSEWLTQHILTEKRV